MAATAFTYKSGGYQMTYDVPGSSLGAIDLGTTQDGIRFSSEYGFHEITEDRYGLSVIESLFLGITQMFVTFEGMVWRSPTTGTPALMQLANIFANNPADPVESTFGMVAASAFGTTLQALAGTLTLTAITGKLLGSGTAQKIEFWKAVPVGPFDTVLSLKRPIPLPFTFRIFPRLDNTEFTSTGHLRYFTWTAEA